MWSKQEQALNINVLELFGAKLGLISFFKDNKNMKHIRVMMDNNTAVAYINNMRELDPICVKILLSTYGNGLQNNNYGFQQPTPQDLKMSQQTKCFNGPQNGNLRRVCSNRLLVHLVIQIFIYLHLEETINYQIISPGDQNLGPKQLMHFP